MPVRAGGGKTAIKQLLVVNDNTQPFARMGRKAYRVSPRQPGCRNITRYSAPGFFSVIFRKVPDSDHAPNRRAVTLIPLASFHCALHGHRGSQWLYGHEKGS